MVSVCINLTASSVRGILQRHRGTSEGRGTFENAVKHLTGGKMSAGLGALQAKRGAKASETHV